MEIRESRRKQASNAMTDSSNISLAILPFHVCRTTADGYSCDISVRPRRDQCYVEGAHTDSLTCAHQVSYHLLGYSLVKVSLALVDHHYPVVNGDRPVKTLLEPLEK